MYRKKRSEAERPNWKFCSNSCKSSDCNKKRTKPIQGEKNCLYCNTIFSGSVNSYKFKNKVFCSIKCSCIYKNTSLTDEQKRIKAEKISKSKTGKTYTKSPEACKKQSERLKGEKSHFWKGGVTESSKIIRQSYDYQSWRKYVFERDDYTCQICNERGGTLNADHIKPFAYFPELRFDTNNGRTLCVDCHKQTDTYMGRAKALYEHTK